MVSSGKIDKKRMIAFGLVGFFLFSLSSFLLGKYSTSIDDGIFGALYDTFKVYLLSGLSAFNLLVQGKTLIPENTLLIPLKNVLDGYLIIPESDLMPWVNSGKWETNVYTAFAPWYESLGFISALILGVLLGGYYALWFNSNLGYVARFYQVYLLFPLLIMFFQEHFVLSWKMHFSYLICTFILLLLNVRNKNE